MTVCANCNTKQGPFRALIPGVRICYSRIDQATRIRECLARRDALDAKRYGR